MKKNIIIIILVILILGLAGYIWWEKSQQRTFSTEEVSKIVSKLNLPESPDKEATKNFTNNAHKISLAYPDNWQEKDLGGDKNVTDPLKRENIGFFYLPQSEATKGSFASALVSVKLLRFVTDSNSKINSEVDWYNYINTMVQNYIGDTTLSADYQFVSLDKAENIDDKFTVVENYIEKGVLQGKDYYIYANGEFYQFVSHAPKENFGMILPYIEEIVRSFKKD
ncbi:MAG: hypothetical protein M1338_00540 [Patescibacteria group bacterium]|nr:hypothetical protein [Patescibacteria group bacterium]